MYAFFPLGEFVPANREKTMATNSDNIIAQSHSPFAIASSREKNRRVGIELYSFTIIFA
jgi:hypothetical protein